MESVLNQLRPDGYTMLDKDVPRLSPLIHEHINMLGRYLFAVTDAVAKGELRTLVTKSKGGCLSAFTVPLLLGPNPAITLYYQSFSEV